MVLDNQWRWSRRLLLGLMVLVPAALLATEPRDAKKPAPDAVDLFSAMADGRVEVRVIPKDSTQLKVVVTNKTQEPLNVRLPEAFAAVPVLAQMPNGIFGQQNRLQNGNQNMVNGLPNSSPGSKSKTTQGLGSGFGNAGALASIAPEKVGQFKAQAVCLEHGKHAPLSSIPYEIRPIESFTDKAEVREVCRLLGQGEASQVVAQAAAWHLNNDMSWQQLAAMRDRSLPLGHYFSDQQIKAAKELVATAAKAVQKRESHASASAYEGTAQK